MASTQLPSKLKPLNSFDFVAKAPILNVHQSNGDMVPSVMRQVGLQTTTMHTCWYRFEWD